MDSNSSNISAVILAAGLGTRMKSSKAKVLHELNGKPIIMYVVETAKAVAGNNIVIVIGNQADKVREIVSNNSEAIFAFQHKQLGTGHAVLCSLEYIPEASTEVFILCGDVPLIKAETLKNLLNDHINMKRDATILAVDMEKPDGYGRLVIDSAFNVSEIIEHSDANEEQKKIKTINSGIYCVKKEFLMYALPKLKQGNAQKEYYLTDIVKLGYKNKKNIGAFISSDSDEVTGINSNDDLVTADKILKKRLFKMT